MVQVAPVQAQANTSQSLCMLPMQLPSFRQDNVVCDDISEFLERIAQQKAHLPIGTRLSLLEQLRVSKWPRSVLSITKTTEGCAKKTAEEQLNLCIERLRTEFGKSKEDKCRHLAGELSFQTPLTASNANQLLDEWKVTPPK